MAIPAGPKLLVVDGVNDAGTMTARWTDPTGEVWDLSDIDPELGWFTKPGIKGWGATSYTLTTDKLPRGGVSVRAIRSEEGRLIWPLHIYGETHVEWLQRYRALKRAFLMTVHRNEPGTLRVTRPDGSAREIECIYESGFDGEGGSDDWLSANPVLTLMCPDGYWRDITPVVVPRSFNAGGNFFSPYPTVTPASVLGDSLVNNPGDVDAWPDWTITGPATVITATNNTTGQQFRITKSIGAGELITITTKRPTVRGPLGENLVSSVNWAGGAYLWRLLPDQNSVSINVAGAASGTAIEMKFYPRYEGA